MATDRGEAGDFPSAFQSTPPIRVATAVPEHQRTACPISIHATHTGGDWRSLEPPPWKSYFNPRHPYGWRQGRKAKCPNAHLFQSTPPIRVATESLLEVLFFVVFQSTPPIRVATQCLKTERHKEKDFNPRHPYGWRP